MTKKHLFECETCSYQWAGKPLKSREQVRGGRVKCPHCNQWRGNEIGEEIPAELKKRKSEEALLSGESKVKSSEEKDLDSYFRLIKKLRDGQELETGLIKALSRGGVGLDDVLKIYLIQQMAGSNPASSESEITTLLESQQSQISHLQKTLQNFMSSQIRELRNRPSAWKELQAAKAMTEELGYSRGGRGTLDVISEGVNKIDQRAEQGLRMLEPYAKSQFKPKVSRSPRERREKAEEIEERIGKSEELLKAENDLMSAYNQLQGTQRKRFSGGKLRAT